MTSTIVTYDEVPCEVLRVDSRGEGRMWALVAPVGQPACWVDAADLRVTVVR